MEAGRREFLKRGLYGLFALFGLGFLIPGIRLLAPLDGRKKELAYVPLIGEEEIPRAGVKKSEVIFTSRGKERKARVFITSTPDGLLVLSAVCSHLGCLVNYSKEKKQFICPCHGGRYDLTGANISGPPPAPLSRLPVRIENGIVLVGIKV